jgi:hypothetical protein
MAGRNHVALATAQDVDAEVAKNLQEVEEQGSDESFADLSILHPPV